MREIVNKCTHGIDIHTAAIHRTNLPQIRANLENSETYRCAKAFASPVIIQSNTRDGSLRQAASNKGIPILLYEAGEALRFDHEAISIGVKGIFRVMEALNMYHHSQVNEQQLDYECVEVKKSKWLRASQSGIFIIHTHLGAMVKKKQIVGTINDAFGNKSIKVKSNLEGIVIGHVQNPLVSQGDALIHIGAIE
jgi:predicted deacylase